MGGNALKNCKTRRYNAAEYYQLRDAVLCDLDAIFLDSMCDDIPAYRSKESFGDMDILLESDTLPHNWQERVICCFQPKEYVKNGNCFSFEYEEFQIDLIVTPSGEYETSYNYFAWNDLGNLLGRIAHKMGLKLGHDGLAYNWRIDETQHFRTVVIEKDWCKILPVLGYDYERYKQGFDTLEDIFKFVVSSEFFHKDIYLLHNRNHAARIRDRKRKTYTEFLKWIEGYEETLEQQFHATWAKYHREESGNKKFWLPYLFKQIPHFESIYNEVQKEWDEAVEFKRRFNGDLVKEWLGLEGKELGNFMRYMRENGGSNFKTDILKMNPRLVERYVCYFYDKYCGRLPVADFNALELQTNR
jgi:hypothetical protein